MIFVFFFLLSSGREKEMRYEFKSDQNNHEFGQNGINYPSLDGDGITQESDKHVHLVIIGMTEAGVTMGVQAAQLLHFPNAVERPENNSRITFVDKDIQPMMDHFRHRYKHLFETEECYYTDLTQDKDTLTMKS